MIGKVDALGRALLDLQVSPDINQEPTAITAWVDTAFNGELVVPRSIILSAGFKQSASCFARLADGKQVILESYTCVLDWFDNKEAIEVIANEGATPLLGVGLLDGHRLVVDYRHRELVLE